MVITIKLFATFMEFLPANRDGHSAVLELPENATISTAIKKVNVPDEMVHLILINGVYVNPELRNTHQLVDGDVLALWPAVAGG